MKILTVGPYALPGWTGAAAGLESLDRVVAVRWAAAGGRADLYELVRRVPVGRSLRYQIVRDGTAVEMAVPTMTFSLHDWFLSFGVYIVIGVAFPVIGVAPYYVPARHPGGFAALFHGGGGVCVVSRHLRFHDRGALPKEVRIFAPDLNARAAIHLALIFEPANHEAHPARRVSLAILRCGLACWAR